MQAREGIHTQGLTFGAGQS